MFSRIINTQKLQTKVFQNEKTDKHLLYYRHGIINFSIKIFFLIMLFYFISILIVLVVLVGYKYYYSPRAQIRRYVKLFHKLGYTVFEQPFTFLGVGFLTETQQSLKLHGDSLYQEKNIYPQVDFAIGNVLDKVVIVIVNPQVIKEFWSSEGISNFIKAQQLTIGARKAIGEGVVFSEGQVWKNKRKIISKVFTFDLIKENISKISNVCDTWINQFDKQNSNEDGKVQFNPMDLSERIFNGVMLKCFFGCEQLKQKVKGRAFEQYAAQMLTILGQLFKDPILMIFGNFAYKYGLSKNIRKAKKEAKIFKEMAKQIVQKRTQQILSSKQPQRCTDILQAILNQKKKNKQDFIYSNKDLIQQFGVFLIAGTDTTSRFLTMMLYYIAKDPSIQAKLRAQIHQFINKDEDIVFQNLKKLKYIDWIQFETTRHYGPVNGQLLRVATKDNFLKDIPISKGTFALSQPMGNHYNPKFFKDPQLFRPERWEKECDNLPLYSFTGFCGGPRGCIGKQLAHIQSKIAVVKLVLKYKEFTLLQDIVMNHQLMYEPSPFKIIFSKENK